MGFSLTSIPYPMQFPRPFVERPYYDLANLSSDKRQPALIATIQTRFQNRWTDAAKEKPPPSIGGGCGMGRQGSWYPVREWQRIVNSYPNLYLDAVSCDSPLRARRQPHQPPSVAA